MPTNWTPTSEGDALNAASFNTPLSQLQAEINDLDEPSIKRYTLGNQHLPSQVLAVGHQLLNPGAVHTYNNTVEPYPGWNTLAGWKIINTLGSAGGGTELEAILGSSVDLAGSGVKGVLVYCNIEVMQIYDSLAITISGAFYALFALQLRLTTGAYLHIARTERYTNSDIETIAGVPTQLPVRKDVPIRTLITVADVGATTTIDRVRAVVSVTDVSGVVPLTTTVALRRGNISAIGLRAGTLS